MKKNMSDLKAADELQVSISTENIQSQPNKEQNLFSLAVEMSFDGIIIGELNGIITYVNNAVLELRGASDKKELIGKQLLEFVSEKDRNRAWTLSQN
jgi:PAS domain S-box-containing protein